MVCENLLTAEVQVTLKRPTTHILHCLHKAIVEFTTNTCCVIIGTSFGRASRKTGTADVDE